MADKSEPACNQLRRRCQHGIDRVAGDCAACKRMPSLAEILNKAQDLAAENERLCAENARLVEINANAADARAATVVRELLRMTRETLDEQTRWLAGLDDIHWTKRDRIDKSAHVNRAMHVLKRDRADHDALLHIAKIVGGDCQGRPLKLPADATIQPGDHIAIERGAVKVTRSVDNPNRMEMSFPVPDYAAMERRFDGATREQWTAMLSGGPEAERVLRDLFGKEEP